MLLAVYPGFLLDFLTWLSHLIVFFWFSLHFVNFFLGHEKYNALLSLLNAFCGSSYHPVWRWHSRWHRISWWWCVLSGTEADVCTCTRSRRPWQSVRRHPWSGHRSSGSLLWAVPRCNPGSRGVCWGSRAWSQEYAWSCCRWVKSSTLDVFHYCTSCLTSIVYVSPQQCRQRQMFSGCPSSAFVRMFLCPDRYCYHNISRMPSTILIKLTGNIS